MHVWVERVQVFWEEQVMIERNELIQHISHINFTNIWKDADVKEGRKMVRNSKWEKQHSKNHLGEVFFFVSKKKFQAKIWAENENIQRKSLIE